MIQNPYAKKKSSSQQAMIAAVPSTTNHPSASVRAARQEPPRASTGSSSSSLLPVLAQNHIPASFTQAFGEHDHDDDHHDDKIDLGSTSPAQQPQQQQQPLSDRDHHVLLSSQPHVLHVSPRQKGNGVLSYIRNVPWSYQVMAPDYMFSATSCALFLSIKYHLLHPNYLVERMAELKFRFQVLLVYVDTDDNETVLLQLNELCVRHNFTLLLSWSEAEAARYLESYKALDGKDAATFLQKTRSNGLADVITDVLTTVKGVNKTDATSLMTQFDSIQQILTAAPDELGLVNGLGQVKVQRLYDAFHKPFSKKLAKQRREERLEAYRLAQQEQELDDVEEQELAGAEAENSIDENES
jgi:DNA excision repair protein ERCC-1